MSFLHEALTSATSLIMAVVALAGALTTAYRFSERVRDFMQGWAMIPARLASVEQTVKQNAVASDAVNALIQRKMELVLEALNIAEFSAVESGQWTMVSRELCRFLGAPSEDLTGWQWLEHVAEDERDDVAKDWERAVHKQLSIKRDVCFQVGDDRKSAVLVATPVKIGMLVHHYGLLLPREAA